MRAMFRQFSSIAMSKAPTPMTVLNVISKHIQDLSKKRDHILQLRKVLHGVKVLDMMKHEVLRSQPKVVHQLDFLQKLQKEIVPDGLDTSVPITMTHSHCPLSIIYKLVEDLHQMLAVISQIEESISPGDVEGQKLLNTKASVVYQINALRKVFEDISWESELPSDQLKNSVMLKSRGVADIITPDHLFEPTPMRPKESVMCYKAVPNLGVEPNMKINETVRSEPLGKHRYLLVSNGCQIYCLDLKQSKNQPLSVIGDVPPFPIIASLNLLKENLPTTVGLFKWRSNAYMFGGQKFPKALEEKGRRGIELYNALCWSNSVQPTSSLIYGLSLQDDDSKSKGTSLICHSESNTGNLKKPKIWPIVEEINGEIHVIDCLPDNFYCDHSLKWDGSHEVLDCDNGRWVEEVPTPKVVDNFLIGSYLVVSDKIYAVSRDRGNFLLFDSKKKKWAASSREDDMFGPFLEDVWDILSHEEIQAVRCVGGFPYGDPRDPLYVVIAVKNDFDGDVKSTHALAYLVTSSGQVLCFQRLIHFFSRPGLFCNVYEGSNIIEVEADKLGKKKTMCSIITGSPWGDSSNGCYVGINIFTVEELPDAADKVRQVAAKGSEARRIVELEFARVHVMERHLYYTDAELEGGVSREWIKVQACFL